MSDLSVFIEDLIRSLQAVQEIIGHQQHFVPTVNCLHYANMGEAEDWTMIILSREIWSLSEIHDTTAHGARTESIEQNLIVIVIELYFLYVSTKRTNALHSVNCIVYVDYLISFYHGVKPGR